MRRTHLLCALLLLVVPAAFGPAAATARSRAVEQRDPGLEQAIIHEVNRLRQARGLHPLAASAPLQAAAAFQTRDMIERGYFEHERQGSTFSGRLRRFYPITPGKTWTVGENLAWSSPTISAASTIDLWLNSPPHRRNLLEPTWREVGVGVFSAPSAGGAFAETGGPVFVVTMDFGARGSRLSSLR
jgi:uncharacterized protein YkwD